MATKKRNRTNWEMIPGQVGPDSAGQSGDGQRFSSIQDAADASVQELADTDQALEAGIVEGVADAADHPEHPVHTHLEYGRPDDIPPRGGEYELEEQDLSNRSKESSTGEMNVEDLPDALPCDRDLSDEDSEQAA